MSASATPPPSDPASLIAAMTSRTTLADLPEEAALQRLAELIDASEDRGNRKALEHALILANTIRPGCTGTSDALLDYFEANAWSAIRHLVEKAGQDPWTWNRPEFEREVVCLRRALSSSGYKTLPPGRRLQILTNLGNAMSRLGRTVEAIEYYDRAITHDAKFGMALGNRGQVFTTYATYHYDAGHKKVFLAKARDDFARAVKLPLEGAAYEGFGARLAQLDKWNFSRGLSAFDMNGFELGATKEEQRFRTWALDLRLFLSPLNDVGAYPIAAADGLQLPTIITSIKVGASFHGFFNQLKQEYAAARWFAFEALAPSEAAAAAEQVANRELMLLDARDGAVFGLRLEKLKFAFRSAYSLLDKVAVLLNAYLDLGLPPQCVTIRSVWYEGANPKRALNARLQKNNLPLRGLYWLSKDYVESDKEFTSAMEPDAQLVATVRNRLEHQYLRVTPWAKQLWEKDSAYDIAEELLHQRTLRLLRSARAALIYLVMAIHTHEKAKTAKHAAGFVVSDRLDPLQPDDLGGSL